MSTTTPIHPLATHNRLAKAARIVAFMDANPRLFATTDIETVAEFGQETWLLINRCMGEPRGTVSPLTVTTVLGMLYARQAIEGGVTAAAEAIAAGVEA